MSSVENIHHHFSDNLYAKEIIFKKDALIVQHKHNYDHLSILAKGRVKLAIDDDSVVEISAPACINIKAGRNHSVVALEDCVWFCIHATEEKNPENIDKVLIKE